MATVRLDPEGSLTAHHLKRLKRVKTRVALNAILSLLLTCLLLPYVSLTALGWVIAAPFVLVMLCAVHRGLLRIANWLDPVTLQIGEEQFHNLALVSKVNEVLRKEKVQSEADNKVG